MQLNFIVNRYYVLRYFNVNQLLNFLFGTLVSCHKNKKGRGGDEVEAMKGGEGEC